MAAIEEAFSLLDAGEAGLHATRTRLKRMRDSVLTAAVTGQLVPQDPTDTPARRSCGEIGIEALGDAQDLPGPRSLGWATLGTGGRGRRRRDQGRQATDRSASPSRFPTFAWRTSSVATLDLTTSRPSECRGPEPSS